MLNSNEHKLSALEAGRPEQNKALNARTEQFITAKVSGKGQRMKTGE